jgi:hypothetical protein
VSVQLVNAGANGAAPAGTQYVIAGEIVDMTSTRAANPNYKAPQKPPADDNLGKQLVRSLEKKVNHSVDGALDRNTDAQYLRTYNIDVRVQITKVDDGSQVQNLERRSIVLPENGPTAADLEKTAVESAVKQALELTLKKHPL